MLRKGLISFLFYFLAWQSLFSAHIIGGDMYYECLGYAKNGTDSTSRRYLLTIKLYRDCQAVNAAYFDQNLGFTIYKTVNNVPVLVRNKGSNEFQVPLQFPTNYIDPPEYPCLILPPNVCVEEGIYNIEFELPIIQDPYTIVWQRCCRNNSITNILAPDATGATFTIDINYEAQIGCNNSPKFIKFPPTVVCVNNPLKFDHSAIDQDGDLLVYEFCEPLSGGGRQMQNNNNPCDDVIPTPDCPPPFNSVTYRAPYTASFPLGGSPFVTINSVTGLITGTPQVLGQFVVGVCVYEYRNGVLLSVTRRDFQFNVANCEGTIIPRLSEGKLIAPKTYELLVCGNQYTLKNGSLDQRFIKDILWTYENGNGIDTFMGWQPQIFFKRGGLHSGRFILNPNTNCSDTGQFFINVVPDLKVDYTLHYDSCQAGPVSFKDLSSSSYSTIKSWVWRLGDGYVSLDKDPVNLYAKPGRYTTSLDITDNYGCIANANKNINWFPAPSVVVFRPNVTEGCVPLEVQFKNISFPTDNNYNLVWKLTDGSSYTGENIVHVFDTVGTFGIKLEVTSPIGCYNEGDFKNVVQVYGRPLAEMTVDRNNLNINDALVNMTDHSKDTKGRTWIIDDKDYFFDKDFQYTFKDTGWHQLVMIATDRFLCTDTLVSNIFVFRDFTLYMPNAFTPNGDGKNEFFQPVGQISGTAFDYYTLKIYDRWGSMIYESDDPFAGWNGKYLNTGKDLPNGAYHYDLVYKVARKEPFHEHKIVALIR